MRPDVAVLDFSMPELNGLEATRRIRQVAPEVEVLVFTMHESEELIREVLAAALGATFSNPMRRASLSRGGEPCAPPTVFLGPGLRGSS